MDTSDKTPSSRWEVLSRNRAARMIAGRLVLDGEIELSEGNGRYTYIHCTNLNDIYTFRVAGTSILDDVEDREFSPVFGIPLPPYERLLEEYPCRETYRGLEAGRTSPYYPYFCQLAFQMDEMLAGEKEDEEETPVDTWDRPDMTDT
ncbi:hypothetical protein ACT01_06515 [Megasphaera hexanoica]|nr:hypothetical protein ACT01_06515 [Megasphaera hexanoica]